MIRRVLRGPLPFALLATACAARTAPAVQDIDPVSDPPRVVLLIADGTGIAQWTVGLLASDSSVLHAFPVVGLVDTRNVEDRITDSGAAATAYAAGVLTYNRAIGMGPDSLPVTTVMERATERGIATGIIATSSVVHATPAAFVAHVPDRYLYEEIAAHIATSAVDVVLGGGRKFFDPSQREDGADLLALLDARWTLVRDAGGLTAAVGSEDVPHRLAGLFAETALESADRDRSPTLPAMTEAALRILDRDPDGFVLMVESSQIDWLGHDNQPWERMAREVLDAEETMRVVLDYIAGHPGALFIVVADHETAGLTVVEEEGAWSLRYASEHHTAELVPLFAIGRNAGAFGGVHRIDAIGRLLSAAVLGHGSVD